MTVRWQYAILALVLAVFTWYLVTGREKVEVWMPMTVELINVPDGLLIQEGLVNKIEIRVRGPKGLVRALDDKKLVYSLDAGKLKSGENLIEFKAEKIPLSRAYEVVEIKPSRTILSVDRMTTKTVPVNPVWSAEESLAGNYHLVSVTVQPDHVELKGPQNMLKHMDEVEAILMTGFDDDIPPEYSEEVPVFAPDEVESNPGTVRVTLEIAPVTQVVPVKLRNFEVDAPAGMTATVANEYVLLEIEGPRLLFANDEYRQGMAAVVRMEEGLKAGEHMLDYWVKLPDQCRVVSREPAKLKVVLKKP